MQIWSNPTIETSTRSHHHRLRSISHQGSHLDSELQYFTYQVRRYVAKLSSIPTSATTTQSDPETLINPMLKRRPAKMVHKIRVFRGLRNNREDPADILKALDWAYRLYYK